MTLPWRLPAGSNLFSYQPSDPKVLIFLQFWKKYSVDLLQGITQHNAEVIVTL